MMSEPNGTDENVVVDIQTAKANGARTAKTRDRKATGDWRDTLTYTQEHSIEATTANLIVLLGNDPAWADVLAFDEFSQTVTTLRVPPWDSSDAPAKTQAGEWSDSDMIRLQAWLSRHYKLRMPRECVADAVCVVAEKTVINPPKKWLESLRWDGVRRVDGWLAKYLGVAPSPYVSNVGRWVLVSAVARILRPGCKCDCMIVLEGPQGIRKSTSMRVLFSAEWFSDTPLDLSSKDRFVGLRNNWCHEFAELDAFGRAEIARVKSFLSSSSDDYRPPYARTNVKVERRCVFVGTVNDSEYLRDATGNRRFWPVRCGRIDIDALERDREQLMGEARELFLAGHRWWPENDEVGQCETAQADRAAQDAWMPFVAEYAERQLTKYGAAVFVTVGEVLGALSLDKSRWGQSEQNRIARCLIQLGWQSTRRRRRSDETGRARRVYGYVPPGVDLSRVDDEAGTQVGTGEAQ
jgi:putative DNA primase/helicase